MEKLSIEQKAKAYDELLLKLQKAKVDDNVCDEMYYRVIDDIVPELKESEDERMWKLIKKYAHYNISDMALETDHITREQLESWLEKQGEQILANSTKTCKDEQKHVDKVEPKFKVGYWVTCKEIDTALIVNITDDKYEVEFIDGNKGFPHIDYVDRLFSFWTIQDAKDGDVLNSPSHHLIWIYKDNEHYYACVNMNYVTKNVATNGLIKIPSDACPATKEQREQLKKAMTDAGYTFDFEKKELKKIDNETEIPYGSKDSELQEATYYIPKGFHAEIDGDKVVIKKGEKPTEWSEDDEGIFDEIIDFLENGTVKLQHDLSLYASWLKSLKQRSTWKPSDEQIKAVRLARSFVVDDFGEHSTLSEILVELEEQLKKLRGE